MIFEAGRSRIAGLSVRRFERTLRGQGRVFAVKFRPAAFQPLLGAPMSSITEKTVALRRLFGRAGDRLRDAVLEEPSLAGRIARVEAFLAPRLSALPPRVTAVRALVERLAVDHTLLRVEQAAAILRTDVRTLQRRFLHDVGPAPSGSPRYACTRPPSAGPPRSADWRARLGLGYFEQSHFSRDLHADHGVTPASSGQGSRT